MIAHLARTELLCVVRPHSHTIMLMMHSHRVAASILLDSLIEWMKITRSQIYKLSSKMLSYSGHTSILFTFVSNATLLRRCTNETKRFVPSFMNHDVCRLSSLTMNMNLAQPFLNTILSLGFCWFTSKQCGTSMQSIDVHCHLPLPQIN